MMNYNMRSKGCPNLEKTLYRLAIPLFTTVYRAAFDAHFCVVKITIPASIMSIAEIGLKSAKPALGV